jgi:hypothetical protein
MIDKNKIENLFYLEKKRSNEAIKNIMKMFDLYFIY